ncbi:MAG: discoidin domain-containing protein, partial [Sedimentisphaerales bacterium]|nr:discoidin domain-containing protein [Sedimentisphaerales bacterium]
MESSCSFVFSGLLCRALALLVVLEFNYALSSPAYGQTSENLALYRPVTVSSVDNYPEIPEFAVDGQPDTRWRSNRNWQQGQIDTLTVDLQGNCLINKIDILWSASADRPVFTEMRTTELSGPEQVTGWARVYDVQVSTDGENWATIGAITGGAGGLESVTPELVPARYVRIAVSKRSHNDCSVAISEISVYGTVSEQRPAATGWPERRKAKSP